MEIKSKRLNYWGICSSAAFTRLKLALAITHCGNLCVPGTMLRYIKGNRQYFCGNMGDVSVQ